MAYQPHLATCKFGYSPDASSIPWWFAVPQYDPHLVHRYARLFDDHARGLDGATLKAQREQGLNALCRLVLC